jgi:hypothetical protein
MFSYLDATPTRPSLEQMLEDYWDLMPEYQVYIFLTIFRHHIFAGLVVKLCQLCSYGEVFVNDMVPFILPLPSLWRASGCIFRQSLTYGCWH